MTAVKEFRSEVVDVTPALAKKWLEKNHPEQRNIAWARVESFANDMIAGNWKLTHQGICFDGSGYLTDGQHRLHALVKADVPVKMMVIWNPAATMQDPVDRGGARSVWQLANMHVRVTGALALLHKMEDGNLYSNVPVTLAETLETMEHHKEYMHLIECSNITKKSAIVSGVRAACVWLMPLDEHSVLQWLGAVQSGEMLTRGMPAYTFRSWRDRTKNVSPTVVMLAACNSLRHHLHGATLTSVHTGESGYRSATTRRRALKIPHTPGPGMVISLGWGLQKGEEV